MRAALRHLVTLLAGAMLGQLVCSTVPVVHASLSQDDVVTYIKNLRLQEVEALIANLEAELGVKASGAYVVLAGPSSAPPAAPAPEQQTEFTVVLKSVGDKKIEVIKAIREITGLGIKEAKDLVESAPRDVMVGISKDDAKAAKAKLVAAGAEAAVR